ncbi:MAG: hypothetical protein KIG24_04095, partial [Oscillospiraceae bacterium]|nr:hypothetical protein [Oscillospiraceae bacterium]
MNAYDIVVAPHGDDSNPGTPELPLRTPGKAKEKAKSLKNVADDTVTVWFREGTYALSQALKFTCDDLGDVVYRSYPGEEVIFSGAKEISGWSEATVNGVRAFVRDVPIESDENYFNSLYKGEKRLSRSNYPKERAFSVA